MLAALATASWTGEANGIDPTYIRVHRFAQGAKGSKAQHISPSRGDQAPGIHEVVDVVGRPAVVRLTPFNDSDLKTAPDVLAAAPGQIHGLIADKDYGAN